MEEKKMNEAQVAEQTASQDENKNEQMSMTVHGSILALLSSSCVRSFLFWPLPQ